jgi:hypothetical protein
MRADVQGRLDEGGGGPRRSTEGAARQGRCGRLHEVAEDCGKVGRESKWLSFHVYAVQKCAVFGVLRVRKVVHVLKA